MSHLRTSSAVKHTIFMAKSINLIQTVKFNHITHYVQLQTEIFNTDWRKVPVLLAPGTTRFFQHIVICKRSAKMMQTSPLTWNSGSVFYTSYLQRHNINTFSSVMYFFLCRCVKAHWTKNKLVCSCRVWKMATKIQFCDFSTNQKKPKLLYQKVSISQRGLSGG